MTTGLSLGLGLGLTLGAGGGAPVNPVDPTRYMFSGTRVTWSELLATPTSSQITRVSKIGFVTPDYSTNNFVFTWDNFSIDTGGATNPELPTGNAITINGAALLVGSTYYPITLPTNTIADKGILQNSPLALPSNLPARTQCYIITIDSCLVGQNQPGGFDRQSGNGEIVSRTTAPDMGWLDGSVAIPNNTGLSGGTNTARPYGPSGIVAQGWDGRPVGYIVGDSMAAAATDIGVFVPTSGVQGWLARGMDSILSGAIRYPHFNGAVTGTRPSGMSSRATGQYECRGAHMDALKALNPSGKHVFTFWVSEHINNDASAYPTSNPSSVSLLTGVMQSLWSFMHSEYPNAWRVQTAAFNACTSDSSAWRTFAGQLYRTTDADPSGGARWAVSNSYINSIPTTYLDAVIDQTPICMDTTLRKYLAGDWTGTLANDYVAGSVTVVVNSSVAPIRGDNIVVGVNAAGYTQPALITNVASAGTNLWTVTLFAPLINVSDLTSHNHSTGAACGNSVTQDGLHQPPRRHAILGDQAIVPGKLTGKFGPDLSGIVVAPVNMTLPAISGTATPSGTLTTTNGIWTGSPTGYAYQWLKNGSAISGATSATYNPVSGDIGAAVSCCVTATNSAGSTPATSASVTISSGAGASHTFDSSTTTFDSSVVTFDMA